MNKLISLTTESHELSIQKSKSVITDEYGTWPGPDSILLIANGADDDQEESVIIMSNQQAHRLIEQLTKVSGYHKAAEFSKN